MVTREQALKTLKSLKPAPVFIQCYQKDDLPYDLDIYFSVPEEFFMLTADEQEVYTNGRLIPLLDDGNFDVVLYYDPEENGFVQMDVDEGKVDARFANWQQYVASLLIRIAESIDDDADLKAISKTVGFKYFRELTSLLKTFGESDDDDEGEEEERAKRKFIESLPG